MRSNARSSAERGSVKIVHILPPLTKGGAEKVAVDLANHAAREGHEVAIVAAYPVAPQLLLQTVDPRVQVHFVAQRQSRLLKYFALGPWLARNRRWLLSCDVVHCHLTFGAVAGSLLKLMRKRRRRPIIVETYHAVGMPIAAWKRGLAAMLAGGRDGFALMAEDDYWRRFRERHPRLMVRFIPNGISPPDKLPPAKELARYKASLGIPEGAPVVGTVGRLVEGRMPLRMVDVFAQIDRLDGSNVHFYIGGEGDLLDETRAYAEALGISERVHLPGLVEQPLLAFGIIDLYVSINVGPITGIAALEAAACRKPVIAMQAREDYVAGADDWIWSSSDPAEVAVEAIRLLADGEARKRLGIAQAERVRRNHSSETMAGAYDALYSDCLGK
jgi:glycosyltransferase involved in cell wall biosynthesis